MGIIGFDWDGTLVESFGSTPLPGAAEALSKLPAGAKTFIATNQAGPVFRAVLNDPKYPTVEDVAKRIAGGLAALSWKPDLLMIAVHPGKDGGEWDDAANRVNRALSALLAGTAPIREVSAWPDYRKPRPYMLVRATVLLCASITDVTYIGDMDSDRLAAEVIGARFVDAEVWRNGVLIGGE